EHRTDESAVEVELDYRKVSRLRDADQRICGGHASFVGGDVRTAFEKLRWKTDWEFRRRDASAVESDGQVRARLADRNDDGMFECRSVDAQVGCFRASRFELRLRLGHIHLRNNSLVESIDRQLKRDFVRLYALFQEFELFVETAQLEIVHRDFGMG